MKPGHSLALRTSSKDQAIIEASRCLACYEAPCERACPAGVRVATFIRRIRFGDFAGALRKIVANNVLAGTCGMTCPRGKLCEEACVLNRVGAGIRIRDLQLSAFVFGSHAFPKVKEPSPQTKVAIIGSGPAGIACAYYLKRADVCAVVFERGNQAGGLLTSAIPPHRVDRDIVEAELDYALSGIEVRKKIDPAHLSKTRLHSDGFAAIFLATGLWQPTTIPLEGSDAAVDGFKLLSDLAHGDESLGGLKGKIGVIGGGNTACDVALSLKLHTESDVTVLYRRGREEMPAFEHQVEEALIGGVKFEFNVAPLRILSREDRKRLLLVRTRPGPVDESGRPKPLPVSGSEFSIDFDHIVLAIGRMPDASWLKANFNLTLDGGRLRIDENTMMTAEEGIFAGGDLVRPKGLVVEAVADGLKAARAISMFLMRQA